MISRIQTAEQLLQMPSDGNRYELVKGVLKMMSPAGGRHGRIAARIGKLLANHVDDHQLGCTFAAETGFLLARDPDTVRAPDAAFVSGERMRQIEDERGFLPLAPDVAVEVASPEDRRSEIESKALMWLDCGTRLVLVVEPAAQLVHVYRSPTDITRLTVEDMLDASDVVSGWKVAVAEFFP
jgi:Uma2 family endonuclease